MHTTTWEVCLVGKKSPLCCLKKNHDFFANSSSICFTLPFKSFGRAHPRVLQYNHLFTVVSMYNGIQCHPGLLGAPTNVLVILPPMLTIKVIYFSCLSPFFPTSPWSWLPVHPIKLLKRKALVTLLWLLTRSKTPWMIEIFNQVDQEPITWSIQLPY